MLSLLNAIYARFTADTALTSAFPGGLHRDRAPEGTAMPYVISHVLSSKAESSYGGITRSETQIRFSAFGVGHDATGALLQTLMAEFDTNLLTLADGSVHDTIARQSDAIPILHRGDSTGNDVWEWAITYEYGVTH